MTYLDEFEAELRDILSGGKDVDDIVKFVKGKVLQSFRNGQASPKKKTEKETGRTSERKRGYYKK